MFETTNNTPFQTEFNFFYDKDGVDHIVAIAKGTYTFSLDNAVTLAEEQLQIRKADEYNGAPGASSIKYASELALQKQGSDIVLVGNAYAQQGKVSKIDTMIRVGVVNKKVRVFGDREWKYSMGMVSMTKPVPFDKVPLVYEKSFGGVDKTHPKEANHGSETRNPVGTGFRINKSKESLNGHPLPNLEDPDNEIKSWKDKPAPNGYGFISPSWEPRKNYAGTYDKTWEEEKMPFLPDDFSNFFFNSANPSLISKNFLTGGESVLLHNLHREKSALNFKLPEAELSVSFTIQGKREKKTALLDTVLFEPDENRFTIIWRASAECLKKTKFVDRVTFDIKKS